MVSISDNDTFCCSYVAGIWAVVPMNDIYVKITVKKNGGVQSDYKV